MTGYGFSPDAIVSTRRGGLFVADLFSDVQNAMMVVPLVMRSYVDVKERGVPIIPQAE
ncbi:MAG: hypothetical protein ABDH63_06045 [Candidatus Caldarchaeales archaeon]